MIIEYFDLVIGLQDARELGSFEMPNEKRPCKKSLQAKKLQFLKRKYKTKKIKPMMF